MSTERGSALASLLAFVVSMAVIMGGVYLFFKDYRTRYIEPLARLRQPLDSLQVIERDSLLADSLRLVVGEQLRTVLEQRSDSLRLVESGQSPEKEVTEDRVRQAHVSLDERDALVLSRVLEKMDANKAANQLQRLGIPAAARVLENMQRSSREACLGQMNEQERALIRRELRKLGSGNRRS